MTAFAAVLLLVFCNGVTVVRGKSFVDVYVGVEPSVFKAYVVSGTPTDDLAAAIKRIEEGVKYTMAEVNNIYQRIPGLDIEIRVSRLDMLNTNVFNNSDSPQGRARITAWLHYLRNHNLNDTLHYDIALLFTGHAIRDNQNNLEGISIVDSVCTMDALAVVKFYASYSDVLATVHEIGHVLGLENDNRFCLNGNLMTEWVPEDSPNKWDFSECSLDQLKESIPFKKCLETTSSLPNPSRLPPKEFLDIQGLCKRYFANEDSYVCTRREFYNYARPQGDAVCGTIYCDYPNNPSSTSLDTECKAKTDAPNLMVCGEGKRCQYGKCMDAPSDLPTPSDVKNDCLFGDGRPWRRDCQEYLTWGNGSNAIFCTGNKSPYVQAQCCNSCVTMGLTSEPACPSQCGKGAVQDTKTCTCSCSNSNKVYRQGACVCPKQCGNGETQDDNKCSCAKDPCPSGSVRNINTGLCDACSGDQGIMNAGTFVPCPTMIAARPDLCESFPTVKKACCQTCANTKKPGQA